MNALALTDHGNLYGAIEFYRECRAAGLNPIIGYEAYVAPGKRTEREARRRGEAAFHLTLLAQNRTGFQNLVEMASIAFLEGYHYVPRIDKELLAAHQEGIICLSGCASGEFSEFILKDQLDEATRTGRVVRQACSATISTSRSRTTASTSSGAVPKGRSTSPTGSACRWWPPATPTTCARATAGAHDVLLCINTGKTAQRREPACATAATSSTSGRRRRCTGSSPTMRTPSGAARRSPTAAPFELDFRQRHFPVFTPPDGKKPEDYLRELCEQGLQRALRRPARPRPLRTGWSTSWTSSAGWASPAIS